MLIKFFSIMYDLIVLTAHFIIREEAFVTRHVAKRSKLFQQLPFDLCSVSFNCLNGCWNLKTAINLKTGIHEIRGNSRVVFNG